MIFKKFPSYDPAYAARIINDNFRRKEVFKLYLEALRMIRRFTWEDENGIAWSQSLRLSARQEFESSREEKDPEILARALFNARMALDELEEKYEQQRDTINQKFTQHVNDVRVDRNRGVHLKEHEIFERKMKPEQITAQNMLFQLDYSQFQTHPQMTTQQQSTFSPQRRFDPNDHDVYAAAARLRRNNNNNNNE